MIGALITYAEEPGSKTVCARDFSKTLSVHLGGNEYPTLFRVGKAEGDKEDKWHRTSVTQLLVRIRLQRATSPHSHRLIDNLYLLFMLFGKLL